MKPANRQLKLHFIFFVGLLTCLMANGCGASNTRVAPDSTENPTFIPPTLAPTAVPPTVTPTSMFPTAVSASAQKCTNILTWISDLTIQDGTIVPSNATIDKRWQVENSGTCTWGAGYKIKLIRGDALGASPEQVLVPIRSNTKGEIRILFTAPKTPNKYSSVWQAYDPDGQPFGDPIYMNIVVKK